MNWILVGVIAGSLVTSTHETKEACYGLRDILKELKVDRLDCQAIAPPQGVLSITGTGSISCGQSVCSLR